MTPPDEELEFDPELFELDPEAPVPVKPPTGTVRPPTPVPSAPENQRKHLRFRIDGVNANMYVKRMLATLGLGRSNAAKSAVNLSEGGLLVASSSEIQSGAVVRVRLEIEKFQDVIEADAVVRWCRASARENGMFYVGLAFQGLNPTDQKKIGRMREWFTSPEYRMRTAARKRQG